MIAKCGVGRGCHSISAEDLHERLCLPKGVRQQDIQYVKKWHMMPAAMPVLCGQSRYNPVDLLSNSEYNRVSGYPYSTVSVLVARKVLLS